jgi:endonuclease/exonuclease/phosphatase family metal-dependent hydrolase
MGRLTLFNVHPVSPREDFSVLRGHGLRREILSGHLFSGDAEPAIQANAGLRALQAQAIADAVASMGGPTIIAGDTNLPGLSGILRHSLSQFQDGFQKAGWGFGYTYPNDRRPWMRIDRILATRELRFLRFEVGRSAASDHLCVVADLQFRR